MRIGELRTACARGEAMFLPGRDAPLAMHALGVAELAGWLLASSGAPLLSVTWDAGEPDVRPLVVRWRGDLTVDPAFPAARCAYPTVLAALERGAQPLLEGLRARWPDYARPRRIGIVTDGAGIAFSPDEPWPLSPGWLARHVRARGSLAQILPFWPLPPH